MAPSPRELSRRHAAVTEGVNSTSSRRGASRCVRQSLPRARGRWREAPDEVPGPVVGAGVPDGPFARLRDISWPAHHPRACAFRYAEREGEGNCGLALPVADSAMPQFPQRSKNARSSTSPKRFSGTARWIGRPQTTLDDIPANFLRHYPQYKKGAFNLAELARLCGISRTTAYKYIQLIEFNHQQRIHHPKNLQFQ